MEPEDPDDREEYPWDDWEDWRKHEDEESKEEADKIHDLKPFGDKDANQSAYTSAYILCGILGLMLAAHLYIMVVPSEMWANYNPFLLIGTGF